MHRKSCSISIFCSPYFDALKITLHFVVGTVTWYFAFRIIILLRCFAVNVCILTILLCVFQLCILLSVFQLFYCPYINYFIVLISNISLSVFQLFCSYLYYFIVRISTIYCPYYNTFAVLFSTMLLSLFQLCTFTRSFSFLHDSVVSTCVSQWLSCSVPASDVLVLFSCTGWLKLKYRSVSQ